MCFNYNPKCRKWKVLAQNYQTKKKKKSNVSSDAVDRVACNLLLLNCECAHPSTFKKNPSGKLRNTFLMEPPVPLGLENFNKDRPIKIVAISMCDKLNMNFKLFIESS